MVTMNQLTLVSLYGHKSTILEKFINSINEKINSSSINNYYNPYNINQIHATIIGLEKVTNSNYYNANLMHDKKIKAIMNFDCLSLLLKSHFPIKIRFGGFSEDFNDFLSFGEKPFFRSFQVNLDKNKIVLIGWPHKNNNFNLRLLWNIRLKIEKECNIRHKYADKDDNDFYLVLGEITQTDPIIINKIKKDVLILENSIHQYLADNPIEIEITLQDLKVIQYQNISLPLETTIIHGIENLTSELDRIKYTPRI
jgi:hypothetical protein